MNETEPRQQPGALWKLFQQLRGRGFRLGIDDYLALRDAARAGFGLVTPDELRDVCCLLWAKSPADPELLSSLPLEDVLRTYATNSTVVILSDAGATRGSYNTVRLLDTVAFLKAIHTYTPYYVWLNPLPERYWKKSTAEQIARHVPMFPLDRVGMYRAVNVLPGRPATLERPL